MKEHPITMSGDHPQKILDGIETMTRRVIKPQPYEYKGSWVWAFKKGQLATQGYWLDHCPYGQVGDRLWVRETHGIDGDGRVFYKADYPSGEIPYDLASPGWKAFDKWTPSIYMPKEASRITLEITEVRVSKLNDITEEDAKVEGCFAREWGIWWQGYREIDIGDMGKELLHQQTNGENPPDWMIEPHRMLDRPDLDALSSARNQFIVLWDSLNAKRGYGWDFNPWVWVLSFKVVE